MKAFIALVVLVSALTASAQRYNPGRGNNDDGRNSGRIVLRDGQTTVRININENEHQLALRIRLLEEAVRDLQAQVYDLRDAEPRTRIVTSFVCSMTTSFHGTFVGKGSSRIEAEALTRQKCGSSREAFCSSNRVNCEQVTEEVVIR